MRPNTWMSVLKKNVWLWSGPGVWENSNVCINMKLIFFVPLNTLTEIAEKKRKKRTIVCPFSFFSFHHFARSFVRLFVRIHVFPPFFTAYEQLLTLLPVWLNFSRQKGYTLKYPAILLTEYILKNLCLVPFSFDWISYTHMVNFSVGNVHAFNIV